MDSYTIPFVVVGLISAGLLSFYVSLAETALMSLSRERVDEWLEQKKSFAASIDRLLDRRRKLLSFLDFLLDLFAFLYYLCLTRFTFISGAAMHSGFLNVSIQEIILLVAGFLIFGFFFQFFPRQLGRDHSEKISRALAPSISVLFSLFGWIGPVFDRAADFLAGFFGKEPQPAKQPALSDDEIKMMVRMGKEEPLEIEKEEKEMIESVMTFGETLVKEIMTPRIDMICVDSVKSITEVLKVATTHGYSKYPVYDSTIDNIVGIVYTKDLFRLYLNGQSTIPLKDVIRKPFFVPESKKVDELLREMQKEKISMVIVVDEYGGTEGLVTVEDLVEEIVGEIADEHDRFTSPILNLGDNTWLVDGRINIEDLNAQLELNLPSEEFETLGGYVFGLMGKVPKAGDKVDADGVTLEVTEIHRQRISKVKVTAKAPVEAEGKQE